MVTGGLPLEVMITEFRMTVVPARSKGDVERLARIVGLLIPVLQPPLQKSAAETSTYAPRPFRFLLIDDGADDATSHFSRLGLVGTSAPP